MECKELLVDDVYGALKSLIKVSHQTFKEEKLPTALEATNSSKQNETRKEFKQRKLGRIHAREIFVVHN